MTPPVPDAFLAYLSPYWPRLLVGVGLLLLTNAAEKAIPWLLRNAVDSLHEGHLDPVAGYAIGVIALSAIMWVVRATSRIAMFNVGRDVEFVMRNQLLERLHLLGPSFFRRMNTGEIMSRATNDLGQVRLLLGFGMLNVVNVVFALTIAIGLMIALSPELTLYALSPLPIFLVASRYFSRAMFQMSRDQQQALARLADRAQENISGVRVVRSFAIEDHEIARFEIENQRALAANMRLVVLRGAMWPALMGISSVATLLVLWRGGGMVLSGELTVGSFTAFVAYLAQLVWPTLSLGFLLSVVQRGRASYIRVREILDAEPSVVEAQAPKPAAKIGAVALHGLTFEYGDNRVLDDVSFEVEAGRSLAIVGRTGSGKSTLATLLPRLLPTPPGQVFLDGTDVTEIGLRDVRKTVGYAQQEPFLFSTTVRNNIAFALADPDAPDAEQRIIDVAREAAVLEEIEELPEGFDTVVGERGVQLSGGQKQRIALARALLNEPTVLVLDDPLSAVDARTEEAILSALDRAGEGRTLILITHRVAAAARADRVIVLDRGRVVERGTHEELLRSGGLYADIARRQRIAEELSAL